MRRRFGITDPVDVHHAIVADRRRLRGHIGGVMLGRRDPGPLRQRHVWVPHGPRARHVVRQVGPERVDAGHLP